MKKTDKIIQAILAAVGENPGSNPSMRLQQQFSISREALRPYFKELLAQGMIIAKGYGKGRRYFPGVNFLSAAEAIKEVKLSTEELKQRGEDGIYEEEVKPFTEVRLPETVKRRVRYVATETLNNVIDHAAAEQVAVHMAVTGEDFHLAVEDDGIGVFQSIKKHFALADFYEAAAELAKGKRTTDPTKHAGEGLFFSARIGDKFSVEANGLKYSYVDAKDDWSIGPSEKKQGSKVAVTFDTKSQKTTKEVFERHSTDYVFTHSSPRLVSPYIITLPPGDIPSRSEAKKILAGAEQFASIVLDFRNVETIGQGFADEVFRVFQKSHPGITITYKNANSFVEKMILHVKR